MSKAAHNDPHPLAGKTARLKPDATHFQVPDFGGSEFRVEDWWDRLAGKSWRDCNDNMACLMYSIRNVKNGLPIDDEVIYGKVGHLGHLVHVSEMQEQQTTTV